MEGVTRFGKHHSSRAGAMDCGPGHPPPNQELNRLSLAQHLGRYPPHPPECTPAYRPADQLLTNIAEEAANCPEVP